MSFIPPACPPCPSDGSCSCGLTNEELRATPVDVNVVSGGGGSTGGLTDDELRATPVPISGVVTANLGTIDGVATETTLAALLVELGQKLEPGGEVALNAATLAALENITVTVANPTSNPETGLAKEVTLAALLVELGQKYEGGPVALDAITLAALETVTVLQGTSPWVVNVDNFPTGTPGLTDTELRATPVPISGTVTANLGTIDGAATEATLAFTKNKFAPTIRTTEAGFANTPGDNTIHTPATGKKIRLYWLGMSSSQDNAAENLVIVKFATGSVIYRWRMGNPGAFSHWEPVDGGVDESLILNLANNNGIDWNITLEEI